MPTPPPPYRRMWLVRHGETDWNVDGRIQGHRDAPRLTARGRRQAEAVADLLASRSVAAVHTSDLTRAVDTAAPLARRRGLPLQRDARLRERCLGVLEGRRSSALTPADSGLSGSRVIDADARPLGGESLAQVLDRCRAFVADVTSAEVADDAGDIVVVAHGGSLRMLRAALTMTSVMHMAWTLVGNGWIEAHPLPLSAPPPLPVADHGGRALIRGGST